LKITIIYHSLIALVFTLIFSSAWSQQTAVRNHYFIQEYLINPAFTGGKNYNPFYMSYRRQWADFKNSPQFFSASGYYILDASSNLAGSIYSLSQGGAFSQTVGQLNYSHDFHFSQWAHFTLGAGLIFNQFTTDFSSVNVFQANDPALNTGNVGKSALDGTIGIKYFLKRFKTGISINNIRESKVSEESQNGAYNKLARELRFIAQYDFTINDLLHVEPLIVYRKLTSSNQSQLDLSLLANYKSSYTLGFTYRNQTALSVIGGIQYNKFYLLYSHEVNISALSGFVGNNNEITVGYRFPLHPSKEFVDNDIDGVINKKDTCPELYGPKKYSGCPLEYWAPLLALRNAKPDTLVLADSMTFNFQQISDQEKDLVKLFLVDEYGNVVYQAMKDKNGFIFNYLPPTGNYFFKIENLPEGVNAEYLEVSFLQDDKKKMILAHLSKNKEFYMFTRLNSVNDNEAKLLIINNENQVLSVGVPKDGVYVFKHIPDDHEYHYSLVNGDSTLSDESFEVAYDFEDQEQTIRTVYHRINNIYKYTPHFENDDFDDLSLTFEQEVKDYVFSFEKLSSEESEMVSLVIVDEDGNVLSTAKKTNDGFSFSYIPTSGEYSYKLENMPEGTDFDFMEINIVGQDGIQKKIKADVEDKDYVFNFKKLSTAEADLANLVIVDEDGNVLSTAEKTADGFEFNYIPTSGEYFYKLENMPVGTEFDFMEINILEQGVKKKVVANVNSKKLSNKNDNAKQMIMNSLIAIDTNRVASLTKNEARKLTHYYTVQVGAFREVMNDETLEFINNNYGNEFHIIKDKRLNYDLYMLGRYQNLSDVKIVNKIIKDVGFSDCFIMGVEKRIPVSALYLIKKY